MLIFPTFLREKGTLVQSHALRESQFILCPTPGFFCPPHAAQPRSGREQAGADEHAGKIFLVFDHRRRTTQVAVTRLVNPPQGHIHTSGRESGNWGMLGGVGVKQKKAPGKDVFMFTYMEKNKVYSMKIQVSWKIHPYEPVCSVAVSFTSHQMGSHNIRVEGQGFLF